MSTGADEAYDEVALTTELGEFRRLSRREFEALPLDQRVRCVLQKKIKFYRRGEEIQIREALRRY